MSKSYYFILCYCILDGFSRAGLGFGPWFLVVGAWCLMPWYDPPSFSPPTVIINLHAGEACFDCSEFGSQSDPDAHNVICQLHQYLHFD